MTEAFTLPPDYSYRAMYLSDLETVLHIEAIDNPSPWQHTHFQSSLRHNLCWVIEYQRTVIGYSVLRITADEAELLNIAIHPHHRQRGLAQFLLNQLTHYAHEKKVKTFFLEVRASNQAAQALYYKLGFHQVGLRKNYYPRPMGREDGMILAKELGL